MLVNMRYHCIQLSIYTSFICNLTRLKIKSLVATKQIMSKFAIKKIEAINWRQIIFQLVIDGIGQLDAYEKDVSVRYDSDFRSILSLMQMVANNKLLPKQKFKNVTPPKEIVAEFEFKYGDLRIYAIATNGGKIIVLGGFKNKQDKDFRRFRSLKQQYLNSI